MDGSQQLLLAVGAVRKKVQKSGLGTCMEFFTGPRLKRDRTERLRNEKRPEAYRSVGKQGRGVFKERGPQVRL